MNEIEQAKELIEKFGKELAPKVCDEIIKEFEENLPVASERAYVYSERTKMNKIKYWQAIKTEIQNFEG